MGQDVSVDLVALRRSLHQSPEIGLRLPATMHLVLDALTPLDVEIVRSGLCSGLVAVIRGQHSGPTVLLRADMDALPITEASGEEFAATGTNMHACGHDLHMAALVGAVYELQRRRDELHGDVLALFQPGEEGAGGAALMLHEGLHRVTGETPVASYGLHVLSYAEAGVFSCREGSVMGAAILFELEVIGLGGHAARPHAARDPISTATLVIQAIQTFVAQRSAPDDPLAVTVGSFVAGQVANVVPESAVLKVSLRAASRERAEEVYRTIVDMAIALTTGLGLRLRASVEAALGPTISDRTGAAVVRAAVNHLFGAARYRELIAPSMLSEDFSLFLEETGGAFVLVGAAPSGQPLPLPTNHSPAARFDDAILPDLATFLAELAVRQLAASRGASQS